jgi:diguanylate cyclase (GGDEF)-like protein
LAAAMTYRSIQRLFVLVLLAALFNIRISGAAEQKLSVDELLSSLSATLKTTPEKSIELLTQLQELRSTFSEKQIERFILLKASSLGLRGKQSERIDLVKSYIELVTNPDSRLKFLYELSDAYTRLGDYENALKAINESILLLPKATSVNAKVATLSAASSLLISLHAYDDALAIAERLYSLETKNGDFFAKCYGLADRISINFLMGNSADARSMLPEAITACDSNNRQMMTLVVKTRAAVDLIDTGHYVEGINEGTPLLIEFSKTNDASSILTKLEEAIARGYLKKGDLVRAEQYGLRAYQRSTLENAFEMREKSSETMAKIKRAVGQLNSALEYYDINLELKKKVLDDQLQKNLAYQRVKFDMQDKANELALSEQKNKILIAEKALQQGKNQNLLLLMTLGLILLSILGAWLIRTLKQKNIFRTSAQIDGLTQVSNRAHFMDCATQAFKNADSHASVVLFDMDHFKKINDTFGHAAGDWVLKTVCDTVKTHLRKTDIFGRLGGEEFAICLSGINQDEVLALAERCRVAISEINSNPCGFSFLITASFGLATRGIRGHINFEETLAAADKALYFSKNEGRNRVSVYQ